MSSRRDSAALPPPICTYCTARAGPQISSRSNKTSSSEQRRHVHISILFTLFHSMGAQMPSDPSPWWESTPQAIMPTYYCASLLALRLGLWIEYQRASSRVPQCIVFDLNSQTCHSWNSVWPGSEGAIVGWNRLVARHFNFGGLYLRESKH